MTRISGGVPFVPRSCPFKRPFPLTCFQAIYPGVAGLTVTELIQAYRTDNGWTAKGNTAHNVLTTSTCRASVALLLTNHIIRL